MKILILQLARLGDLYLTWPAIRALREKWPNAEIHLMVRTRFRQAVDGLESIDHVWLFDGRALLAPVLGKSPRFEKSLTELDHLITQVSDQHYDQIINLTFSPLSSFLTYALSEAAPIPPVVSGYTRSSDGFLAIPDDGSAYFYAQVGIGRANRVHLCELFGHICGVDVQPYHWHTPSPQPSDFAALGSYVGVHVGASQIEKTYPPEKWAAVIRHLLRQWPGRVVLMGGGDDLALAEEVMRSIASDRVLNFVGRTSMKALFDLIAHAQLVIGGNSCPMHIASLLGTRCLNLSFDTVNFWETGPRSLGSRILHAPESAALASDRVALEALQMLNNDKPLSPVVEVQQGFVAYQNAAKTPFAWPLIQSLYMGAPSPQPTSEIVLSALLKLYDLNEIALQQIAQLQKGNTLGHAILDRADEAMEALAQIVPDVCPLVRWYQTEKIRLLPMPTVDLIAANERIHQQMQSFIAQLLEPTQETTHDSPRAV